MKPKSWRKVNRDYGLGYLTVIVFGTLIGAAIIACYHILPFYYYYFELQNQMEQLIRVSSIYTDEELREKLRVHMKRMEIPAKIDQVKIKRLGGLITMSLEYEEDFYLTFRDEEYDIHTFEFHAYAEGKADG